jgi:hypothetical protein
MEFKDALAIAIFIALKLRGWDIYVVRRKQVIRSPDKCLYILHDYCSPQHIIEIVNQWNPLPARAA